MHWLSFCFLQVSTDFSLSLGHIRGMTFLFACILELLQFLFTWPICLLDLLKRRTTRGMQSGSISELKKAYSCINTISKNGLKEEFCLQNINSNQLSMTLKMKMRTQSNVKCVEHRKQTVSTIAALAKDVFTKWIIIVHGLEIVLDTSQSSHFCFSFSMSHVSALLLPALLTGRHIYKECTIFQFYS